MPALFKIIPETWEKSAALRRKLWQLRLYRPDWCVRAAPRLRLLGPPALATAALAVLAVTATGEGLELVAARPLDLALRRALHREPALAPPLKIFSFDDATLTHVGSPDLHLAEWLKVLRALDARRPRAIVIDKIFALAPPEDDVPAFTAALETLHTPVMVGAFVADQVIKGRPQLAPVVAPDHGVAYGPVAALAAGLNAGGRRRIGHVNIESGGARKPSFALANGERLPSLPLLVARELEIGADGRVLADGRAVPLDYRGRQLSSFPDPAAVGARAFSMRALIDRARAGGDVPVVDAGDVVVILPQMFTGNTDFFESPYGMQPGGYFLIATINEVMTGRFPRPFPRPALFVLAVGALGGLLSARTRLRRSVGAVSALAAGVVALGVAGYALLDLVTPWLTGGAAALAAGFFIYLARRRAETLARVRVEADLETAAALQQITIPRADFASDEVKIAAAYVPTMDCAGDWWHHFECNGVFYVIVADATGHGVSAALISTAARAAVESMRVESQAAPAPVAILERMRLVLEGMGGRQMTTCCCIAALDLMAGTLEVANAGLCFPLLIPASLDDPRLPPVDKRRIAEKRGVLTLRARGTPLGYAEALAAKPLTLPLVAGDRIVLFSDGLSEAMDAKGRQWGHTAVCSAAGRVRDDAAPAVRAALLAGADEFRGARAYDDDVTLVVVEVTALRPKARASA